MSLKKTILAVIQNLKVFKLFKMKNETLARSDNLFSPPMQIRGMTKWQPDLFEKTVTLPHVEIPANFVGVTKAGKILKTLKLKIPNFNPMRDVPETNKKLIILDPYKFETISSEDKSKLINEFQCSFGENSHKFDYTNYPAFKSLEVILGDGSETLSSATIVGHITCVNLKDHLLQYKKVIGQLILNTTKAELVVTKSNIIENKFRNLDLEVLAGDESLGK